METSNFTVTIASGEIVGRHATCNAARSACLNDMGRTLVIHDGMGRTLGAFLDGHDLDAAPGTAAAPGEDPAADSGTCGLCSQQFPLLYPAEQYSTADGLPICDACDENLAA